MSLILGYIEGQRKLTASVIFLQINSPLLLTFYTVSRNRLSLLLTDQPLYRSTVFLLPGLNHHPEDIAI